MDFKLIDFDKLNSRQQENYNYAKLGAKLADFGYTVLRLSDDWQGADLIAVHRDGSTDLKIQLKSRLNFEKKYVGKNLWLAFPDGKPTERERDWFIYDHDELLPQLLGRFKNTKAWEKGGYSWPRVPPWARGPLAKYKLAATKGCTSQ